MRLSVLWIALFLVLPLGGCLEKQGDTNQLLVEQLEIHLRSGKTISLNAEIAKTQKQQTIGLMHRTELAEDAAMLFWFGGREAPRSFWMKNTLIPLDMIFIRLDGTIHHIHENAIPHDLTGVSSQGAVAAVLEINAGLSKKWDLKIGDKVLHPYFKDK